MTTPDTYAKCRALLDAAFGDLMQYEHPSVDLESMATLLQSMLTDSGKDGVVAGCLAASMLRPKLKPLEWVFNNSRQRWQCSTPFAEYWLYGNDHDGFYWAWTCICGDGTKLRGHCDSIEQGKALCERDYATRVAALLRNGGVK